MTSWREHTVALSILGVAMAACVVFFFTYRVQYEQRLNDLENARSSSEAKLQTARQEHAVAEQQLASFGRIQKDLDTIYNQRWSTPDERLTKLIGEVKRLAIASQLVPQSYAYTISEDKRDAKSTAVGTATVGISFTVQGRYDQVRRLINLLELSPQFVIIDSISLNGTSNGTDPNQNLSFSLQLKTLFRVTNDTDPSPSSGAVRM
jgi:hypothetical protein